MISGISETIHTSEDYISKSGMWPIDKANVKALVPTKDTKSSKDIKEVTEVSENTKESPIEARGEGEAKFE